MMLSKSSLLITVTLALAAFGTPVSHSQSALKAPSKHATSHGASHKAAGKAIALHGGRRFNSKTVVNVKALNAHHTRTKKRMHASLSALKKNKGHLPKDWSIPLVKSAGPVPHTTAATGTVNTASKHKKRQNGGESLTDEDNDLQWAGPITIGGQQFVVDFDTGSSDLWVAGSTCTGCTGKSMYTPSSTSTKESGTFQIQYGDGSTVSGPEYTDSVTVAGVTVDNQYFSPVSTISSSFTSSPIDGLLGLAWPAISNLKQSPFFNTAVTQGAVGSSQFGFYLASQGSELFLGGTNPSLYTGSIESHSIDSSNGFWQIGSGSIFIGGTAASSGFDAIIDSGTTIMYGPPTAVAAFYKNVPGAKLYDKSQGMYSFPCSSAPQVSFSFDGQTQWAISDANFNLGQVSSGSSSCVGALAAQDLGLGANTWLLGDSFMKNVYTVFDVGQSQVGFAALAGGSGAGSSGSTSSAGLSAKHAGASHPLKAKS